MSNESLPPSSHLPKVKRNKGISPLWALPILTMLLAGWLVVKAIHDAGQRVQIYFSDAAGLVAGRTTIRYQGLEVGMVRDINLSEGLDSIYVDADIYPEATKLLSKETRFWLVKPTASLSGISGLDALVSGNYISIQPGSLESKELETKFVALDKAPADLRDTLDGLSITLKAKDLGGISVGSQIVYKKIPIGEIYHYQLDDKGQNVIIQASIKEEYRHIITDKSRFWNVSGIGAHFDFKGIDVRLESLSALFSGAIAVDSPDDGLPVDTNTQFKLYKDVQTAGRGIAIKVTLPDDNKISPAGAPIMYRGLEVGQVTDLSLSEDRESIIASAAIQPAFSDMLNSGSQFILEEAKVSLSGVENISNLVKGNFLTLVPGGGDKARNFTAIRKNDFNRQQARSIPLQLVSNNSFGLEPGANILYRGIQVGVISKVSLKDETVLIDTLIDNNYASLLRSNNRFFVTGSASAELTESGLRVTVPPAKQLLTGSISFVSDGLSKAKKSYPLYASQSLAELAKSNQAGSIAVTLVANELPPVSKGSPILYRNLEVGSVLDYKLKGKNVVITTHIDNRYKHLITDSTVFWNRSGVEFNASLSGVSVKASPLKTLVQGGIAFDSLDSVENKQGSHYKLYESFDNARKFGHTITLTASNADSLSIGTGIEYNGVKIGELTSLTPDFDSKSVVLEARIYPDFAQVVAKEGSYFWIDEPEIGLSAYATLKNILKQFN